MHIIMYVSLCKFTNSSEFMQIHVYLCKFTNSSEFMQIYVDLCKFTNSCEFVDLMYRGPASVVVHVLRTDGIRGLYRGFVSNVARNTPGELIFFATYEQCRHLARPAGQNKDAIGKGTNHRTE